MITTPFDLARTAWLLWRIRVWTCRAFGHRWAITDSGAPVTTFEICRRCGTYRRLGER